MQGENAEERWCRRWREIRDGWKQMRARGGDGKRGGGKKIGWEMRDCAEAKSRPAGPACCLRDCKLSLRMQTDMQDRHHLPVLPSTTETAAQCVAPPLPFSSLRRISSLSRPGTRTFMNSPYLFPLPPSRYFAPVTWSLFRL